MGCSITVNGCSGTPCTRAISSAASMNALVITLIAGTPTRSAATASCRLHDEQLPQSPTPASTASQPIASANNACCAGAL